MKNSKFTLLTLNTFGTPILSPKLVERHTLLCKLISSMNVDIINFQEVYSNSSLRRLTNGLSTFPYLVHEHSLISPKGGLVTFSKIPIKKISFTHFDIPLHRAFPPKGFLISQLSNDIILINTHLSNYHENDTHSKPLCPTHLKQIHQLVETINRIQNHYPIIITGDFNLAKYSTLYQTLLHLSQTKDVFTQSQSATYHQEYLPSGRKAHCIDYVFISDIRNKISVRKRKTIFNKKLTLPDNSTQYISDHLGLLVQFQLNHH